MEGVLFWKTSCFAGGTTFFWSTHLKIVAFFTIWKWRCQYLHGLGNFFESPESQSVIFHMVSETIAKSWICKTWRFPTFRDSRVCPRQGITTFSKSWLRWNCYFFQCFRACRVTKPKEIQPYENMCVLEVVSFCMIWRQCRLWNLRKHNSFNIGVQQTCCCFTCFTARRVAKMKEIHMWKDVFLEIVNCC